MLDPSYIQRCIHKASRTVFSRFVWFGLQQVETNWFFLTTGTLGIMSHCVLISKYLSMKTIPDSRSSFHQISKMFISWNTVLNNTDIDFTMWL